MRRFHWVLTLQDGSELGGSERGPSSIAPRAEHAAAPRPHPDSNSSCSPHCDPPTIPCHRQRECIVSARGASFKGPQRLKHHHACTRVQASTRLKEQARAVVAEGVVAEIHAREHRGGAEQPCDSSTCSSANLVVPKVQEVQVASNSIRCRVL